MKLSLSLKRYAPEGPLGERCGPLEPVTRLDLEVDATLNGVERRLRAVAVALDTLDVDWADVYAAVGDAHFFVGTIDNAPPVSDPVCIDAVELDGAIRAYNAASVIVIRDAAHLDEVLAPYAAPSFAEAVRAETGQPAGTCPCCGSGAWNKRDRTCVDCGEDISVEDPE